MLGIFKSKIDRLADKRKKLMEKRDKIDHKFQVRNTKISSKITKLQLKSYENDDTVKKLKKQMNFKIDKMIKEICAEQEYVNAISLDEQDEYIKDHQKVEEKVKKGGK